MFTRLFARVLSLLGFMIGFTSEVLAQYGAPVYFFSVRGNVKDIECEQPVRNAKVTLIDRHSGAKYEATTDSLGQFIVADNSVNKYNGFDIEISDADGPANGIFDSTQSHIGKSGIGTDTAATETKTPLVFTVKYTSGAPCDPSGNNEKQQPSPARKPEFN